jgi:hypothetical protein
VQRNAKVLCEREHQVVWRVEVAGLKGENVLEATVGSRLMIRGI